jgi:hypothetical protein
VRELTRVLRKLEAGSGARPGETLGATVAISWHVAPHCECRPPTRDAHPPAQPRAVGRDDLERLRFRRQAGGRNDRPRIEDQPVLREPRRGGHTQLDGGNEDESLHQRALGMTPIMGSGLMRETGSEPFRPHRTTGAHIGHLSDSGGEAVVGSC